VFAKTETEWACSLFGWVVLAKASRKNARFFRFSRTIKNEDLFDSACGFSVKVCKSNVCGISLGVRKQILPMKKIVASVGLVALGTSGLQSASLAGMSAETPKPWAVSATLRGFYDDNVNTASTGPNKQDTFGFEVSPTVALGWHLDQTTITLSYLYSLKYYDTRPLQNANNYDQSHSFNGALDHAFSERYQVSLRDSFVIGQEPDFLRAGNTFTTFQRISGDNIRNYGAITFSAQMTPLFGLELGYANAFYDYHDSGAVVTYLFGIPALGPVDVSPSRSGTADRTEHTFHIDGRWQVEPQTIGVIGYQYAQIDYTGNEPVGVNTSTGSFFFSDVRNSRSHYGYIGADHTFRPDLTGSLRLGAQYIEFYNEPSQETDVSPYVMASLRYTYLAQSYLEAGFSYNRNATDLFSTKGTSLTSDAESATIWASLNHALTPQLIARVDGHFQNSDYNGGQFNNQAEKYYLIGLNLAYHFNPHFSAEMGYNYDKLDSDVGRTFDRNRVYMGVTASY